jgi:hypothetical protein
LEEKGIRDFVKLTLTPREAVMLVNALELYRKVTIRGLELTTYSGSLLDYIKGKIDAYFEM